MYELYEIRKRGGKYEIVAVSISDTQSRSQMNILCARKQARYLSVKWARDAEHAVNLALGKDF